MWQKKKESKVQKRARQQGEQKKVKLHAGCGGEIIRARNGETLKMVDFCGRCHGFLPKEGG